MVDVMDGQSGVWAVLTLYYRALLGGCKVRSWCLFEKPVGFDFEGVVAYVCFVMLLWVF
jgi:hypothetical protein